MIFKLRKIIGNYDIIHIHHPDPMAALALFCSNTSNKKIILHWHSDIIKQKILLKFYNPLQKWLIKRSDKIIATSEDYALGSNDIKIYLKKVVVIPIGVEINFNSNENLTKQLKMQYEGKKIIYSLGRLCYYKGFNDLIDSAKYLDDSYVILIGGEGSLKEKLQNQIDLLGLNEKVVLLGKIKKEDMDSYFSTCSIFCLPSVEKSEAFGIVQIEAMSYSKPIVATKIPKSGVGWVNKDSYSGINVNPKDSVGLANAFKYICNNNDTYAQFSSNSRKRYEDEFTSEKMIDRVLKLYNCF